MLFRITPRYLLALPLGFLMVACGGSTDKPGDSNGADAGDVTLNAGVADPCKNGPHTQYSNDELCIEAPPPDLGFQLHVGPDDPADYDSPDKLAPFVLDAGAGDGVLCQARTTPNTEEKFSWEQHTRMRSGSHHLIAWAAPDPTQVTPPADGTLADGCRGGGYVFYLGAQSALGPQGGKLDVPLGGEAAVAPEDAGIARRVQPNMPVWLETHYINSGDKPMLREVWVNVIYADPSKVTSVMDAIFFIGGIGMAVAPHQRQLIPGGPAIQPDGHDGEVRIMGMAGHVHAHTERETVYLNHPDGTKETIYETFNWAEPITAQFDSSHKYPAPGASPNADGAVTGPLKLGKGDTVTWECDVNNTLDNVTLKWADRAYDGEMCNVFGYYIPGDGTQWTAVSM